MLAAAARPLMWLENLSAIPPAALSGCSQPVRRELVVVHLTLFDQAALECAELDLVLAPRREAGRALHRCVPVRCPYAVAGARAAWPLQHARTEGDAQALAQLAQDDRGLPQHIAGVDHRRYFAEPVADVVEQARLLRKAEFPCGGVGALDGERSDHRCRFADQEAVAD